MNRHLLSLLMLVSAISVHAQSWQPSKPAEGTFYLYNVGAERFLAAGTSWGSRASVEPHTAMPMKFTESGENFILASDDLFTGHYLGDNGYLDNPTFCDWSFVSVEGQTDVYKMYQPETQKFLTWTGGDYLDVTDDTNDERAYWKLVTRDNLIENFKNASPDNPIDATFLIRNAWFAKGNGLACGRDSHPTGWMGSPVTDYWGHDTWEASANYCVEQYHKIFDDYQAISVPNGEYVLSAQGFYRTGVDNYTAIPMFYANDASKPFVHIDADGPEEKPNGITTAGLALHYSTNYYAVTGITAKVLDGTLRVGAKTIDVVDWCAFDNFTLICKGLYFSAFAVPLPNDATTVLQAEQWYYYDIPADGSYMLTGELSDIVCTSDGAQKMGDVQTRDVPSTMIAQKGRIYFKSSSNNATLQINAAIIPNSKTFTACALNVDGLPNTIAGFDLNPDGPGSDGTKLISRYLAAKGYDIIGASEDFNYNGSLMESLNDVDSCGTIRTTLSASGISWSEILHMNFVFDTDGLNLIWKKTIDVSGESWTQWNSSQSGEGNQYIKKGYRYYEASLGDGFVVDIYILHMDAGDTDYAASREGQWRQLAEAINANTHKDRPKLVIGDTNSRYTRENIVANFYDIITDYTVDDAWVNLWRDGIKPPYGTPNLDNGSDATNFGTYEIVDKILYLNPASETAPKLTANSYQINQDYTYGTVNGTDDGTLLGDHRPVVVSFTITQPVARPIGDINYDGKVSIADVTALISIILGKDNMEPYAYDHVVADVNNDKAITIADVTALVNIILGE